MSELIKLQIAQESDAADIRNMMIRIEVNETSRWYVNGERPFIPGFDSIEMHKYLMRNKTYYKIMYDDSLAGVLLILYTGREHARIDRFYIDPSYQNKGIGTQVVTLAEEIYPQVITWTLETTQKSSRNHMFYEKVGYELVGENKDERYYKKLIIKNQFESTELYRINKNYSKINFRDCSMQNLDICDVNMRESNLMNSNVEKFKCLNVNLSNSLFNNVNMSNSLLGDANMDDIEICHASLAGAFIHDINLGSENKRPLTIERCEMKDSKIVESDLRNVSLTNCDIEGMMIDGLLVTDLIEVYKKSMLLKK